MPVQARETLHARIVQVPRGCLVRGSPFRFHFTFLFLLSAFWTSMMVPSATSGWDPLIRAYQVYAQMTPASFGTGLAAATGDFNADGLPDIVATRGDLYGTVSVLLHSNVPEYPAMFLPWKEYPTGVDPVDVAVADMNLDGKLDIVTCNHGSGTLSVLLASGSGFLPAKTRTLPFFAPKALAVADLNNDGLPDAAILANDDGALGVALAANGDSLGPTVIYGSFGDAFDVAIADATGDGIRDIIVTHLNGVSIFVGNNTGIFNTVLGTITTGQLPNMVSIADLNGDALPDMAVACDGSVWTYLGTGAGSFQAPVAIPVGTISACVLPGDLDGDGDVDLASVGGTDDQVAVLKNNGNGSFSAPSYYAGLNGSARAVLADANQDSRPDIINAEVGVLLNDGTGGFLVEKTALTAIRPTREAVADFNRDGNPDVAVSDSFRVSIGLGVGDGTFAQGVYLPTNSYPGTIVTADVNRDGKPDLLVQADTPGLTEIAIFLGAGDGTFLPSQSVVGGVFRRSVAEMSHDGKPDLIVQDFDVSSFRVKLAQGNGSFVDAGFSYSSPVGLSSLCVADWNRDGVTDVTVVGTSGISMFTGLAGTPGSLTSPTIVVSGKSYADVCTGDFNRDGMPDLAARLTQTASVIGGLDVFLGNGSGGFTPYPSASGVLVSTGTTLDTWDANRDGILDLITTGDRVADVLLGNGGGSFGVRSSYAASPLYSETTSAPGRICAGDVNRDGTPDLLAGIARPNTTRRSLITMLSSPPARGNGYLESAFYATLSNPNQVAVGDLDRDGKMDAVTASISFSPGVAVHLGSGNGVLGPASPLAQSWFTYRVGLADLNRDGILDIVASNYGAGAPRVSSMLGVGNGTFGARNDLYINAGLDFEIGDMNRDGVPDVVTATQDSVRVLIGTGNGIFGPASKVAITPVYDLDLADINRDGVLDVVCAGNTVSVIYGNSDGTLSAPVSVGPATSCATVCLADLNRDGYIDIVAPQGGAYYILWGAAVSPYSTNTLTNLPFSAFDLAVGEAQADGIPFLYVSRNIEWVEVLSVGPTGTLTSVGSHAVINSPDALALADMDRDGTVDIVSTGSGGSAVSVTLHGRSTITAVAAVPAPAPRARLRQNYPNPFNPSTTIRYALSETGRVRLTVFDIQGRLVATLVDGVLPAGQHSVPWRGKTDHGSPVASGVYFYRLSTDSGYQESRRMVVMK